MGRRQIKMEMVQDMNTRQVTFSKRRTGLFKKAFSYGKPNLDSVAERFMRECYDSDSGDDEGRGKIRPQLKKMSKRLDLLNQEIETEKKQGEKAQLTLESLEDERFKKPIEKLTLSQLNEYKDKLQTIHSKIHDQACHIQASSSLLLLSKG